MAQNITLLGASYTAVPAVTLPKTGGGTAKFSDASVTTAVASDVAEGKIFLLADGTQATGTASGGGGSEPTYETVIPLQTFNCNIGLSNNAYGAYITSYSEVPIAGEKYRVTFDGTEYTVTAQIYGSTSPYIGDAGVETQAADATLAYPFEIMYYNGSVLYLAVKGSGSHSLQVDKITSEGGGGGSATLITKNITANGTYSASDDSADGYSEVTVNVPSGGSSGLVYETGTYTAAADGNPYISFTNSHTSAPSIIVLMDVSTSYIGTTAGTQYGFFDYEKLFGTKLKTSSTLQRDGAYQWARVSSTGTTNMGSAILADTTTQVTSSGFTPNFNSNSYKCKSGQTYKWIAIWAPTS